MRANITTLRLGEAWLSYPSEMDRDDVQFMREWFQLVLRQMERRAEKHERSQSAVVDADDPLFGAHIREVIAAFHRAPNADETR